MTAKFKRAEEKSQKEISDVVLKVKEEMKAQEVTNIDVSEIDDNYIKIPSNLDNIESKDLSKYFTALTQHRIRMNTLLADVEVYIYSMEEDFNIGFMQTISNYPIKLSKGEKELLYINSDDYARKIKKELIELNIKKKYLTSLLSNLSEALTLISREITRRMGDYPTQTREENVSRGSQRR